MTNQVPSQSTGGVPAILSDGQTTYTFMLAPESLQWSYGADFAVLNVLETSLPDALWKHSTHKLSVPRMLLMSNGATGDVSSYLDPLRNWVSVGQALSFKFGSTYIKRCHITSLSISEKQWRSGKPTQAECNLELLIVREPIPTAAAVVTKAFTERQRGEMALVVKNALKNQATARSVGLEPYDNYRVTIDESGNATVARGQTVNTVTFTTLKTQGIVK